MTISWHLAKRWLVEFHLSNCSQLILQWNLLPSDVMWCAKATLLVSNPKSFCCYNWLCKRFLSISKAQINSVYMGVSTVESCWDGLHSIREICHWYTCCALKKMTALSASRGGLRHFGYKSKEEIKKVHDKLSSAYKFLRVSILMPVIIQQIFLRNAT